LITNNLGVAYLEQGRHREAERHYEQALRLFEAAADHHGVHTARANLAWVLFAEQRFAEFLEAVTPALEFYRRTGAERNAAITQRGIGLAQAGTDQTAAAGNLRQALEIFTRLGSHLDIAMTWNALGETHQRAGDRPAAIAAFSRALHASERCGSVFEQARAHHRLGELAADRRRFAAAREHWTAAFTGYRSFGAPQARQVAQRLTGLPEE
jgi:tetratricopeptide (TPR) repeat protein